MRIFAAIILSLSIACPAAFASDGTSPSAQALLGRIDKEGGRKVLSELLTRDNELERVVSGIESGNASWLGVAVALRPFSDAAISLSLRYAVARALPKAPNQVLALVGHGFSVEDICTSPFIEPDPGVAQAYERHALAALINVDTPSLKPVAAECSRKLRLPAGA